MVLLADACVNCLFELSEDIQCARIIEGQELSQEDPADVLSGIDPEIGVHYPGPEEAARCPSTGYGFSMDEKAQAESVVFSGIEIGMV